MNTINRRCFLQWSALSGGALALDPHWLLAAQARSPSPFLQGNYAPVPEEIIVENLEIVGALPKALHGMFVRNGPNPQFPPRGHYHWFDGDGMLHGVRLAEGKASYRNRYVRTAGWQLEREAGEALWGGFNDPPSISRVPAGSPRFKNTGNTALVLHHKKLLALWEGGNPHEIRLPDLETLGEYTFNGTLQHHFTAHPKVDPHAGEMLCFGHRLARAPFLTYSVVNASGAIVHTAIIELPRPVLMHDFAVTARYAIFMDLPQVFDLQRAMQSQPPLYFAPDFGARFGILPRYGDNSQVTWFTASACYVFHTLCAYEDGNEVVLVACRYQQYPQSVTFGGSYANPDRDANTPYLYEWRFNLQSGASRERPLDDRPSEFPRIHEGHMGSKTRFGYAMGDRRRALFKYDLHTGKSVLHVHGPGRFGGEGVFVPHPTATSEDHGWVVTYVYDTSTDKSEMIIVNAQDFEARPVARVQLPQRIPYGFHGIWIPDAFL